jgi:hypothetical protein
MSSTAFQRMLFVGLALIWLPGCGRSLDPQPAARVPAARVEAEPPKSEIKSYDLTDLPAVEEPLQRPLDGGRLEICPPAEWGFFSQSGYLVVFAKGKVSDLPRITLTAVDSPFGSADTSADNALPLAKHILRKLEQDKRNVREPPKPVKLGERVWIRHVRQIPRPDTPVVVQSLQIVRDGRLYTLEVFSEAPNDSPASLASAINAVRKVVYAVAANARFTKESGAFPPPTATNEAESPAETPSGEAKPAVPTPAEKPAESKPN